MHTLPLFTTFVTLFVVVNPLGAIPVFFSLTQNLPQEERRKIAAMSALTAFLTLLFFALLGQHFLSSMGITLNAFRIAGGIMLFIIALNMLFRAPQKPQEDTPVKKEDIEAISIFPLGIPLLAGPGAIATIILLDNEQHGNLDNTIWLVVTAFIVCLVSGILFWLAARLSRYITPLISQVITRLFGIILGALATQFVIDGILGVFHSAGV